MRRASAALLLTLAGCGHAQAGDAEAEGFPRPDRPVAAVVSPAWSSEPARDSRREADLVMKAAGVRPGMTVADVGAGEGYYTVRLAARVGADGRVLAEDIVPAYHDALAARVLHDKLDNVSVKLGQADDPGLPPASFDRIFLVHMYHEIAQPFAVLWHLRSALKPGGMLAIVDADRPTGAHGTPPALLDCELKAVGYVPVKHMAMPQADGYLTLYRPEGPRPAPTAIRTCKA